MKITGFRFGRLRAPLRTPFKTALRTVHTIDNLALAIDTDTGLCGYGEAPATAAITGETLDSIQGAIHGVMAPALVGGDVRDLYTLSRRIERCMVGNHSAKAAVDMALHDLAAQHAGLSLVRFLGSAPTPLRSDMTVSVDSVEKMSADARAAVQRGFRILKIKLGVGDSALEIERVRSIAACVPSTTVLRLDANQGWRPKDAVHILRSIEALGIGIELLEQPVPARDIEGLKFVTEHINTPVMADESVTGPEQAIALIRNRAADIINIKLMKCGGIRNALRIVDIAALYDVPCMMGCMLESSISVAAAAHVAAARADVIRYTDLDGPMLCSAVPVRCGVHIEGDTLSPLDVPGLGLCDDTGIDWQSSL